MKRSLQLAAEAGPEAQAITAHHHLGLALLYRELGHAEDFAQHWQKAEALGQRTTLVDWPYRWHVAQARVKRARETSTPRSICWTKRNGCTSRIPCPICAPSRR